MDCPIICYAKQYGDVASALKMLCTFGVLYGNRNLGFRLLERCLQNPCNVPDCNCRCAEIGDEVYDALASVGADTARRIAKRLGRGYASVVRRLRELETAGLVRRVDCGDVTLYTCI